MHAEILYYASPLSNAASQLSLKLATVKSLVSRCEIDHRQKGCYVAAMGRERPPSTYVTTKFDATQTNFYRPKSVHSN